MNLWGLSPVSRIDARDGADGVFSTLSWSDAAVLSVSPDPDLRSATERPRGLDRRSERRVDEGLVQSCLQGDHRSFRQLYHRHQGRVRSILFQLCGPEQLDDLVQEVFLRAWKGLPKFKRSAQFSTWLYRITWNVASDQRRRYAQARSQLQILKGNAAPHHSDPGMMHLHYRQILQQGLDQLSLDHRSVLVMHDLEQLPQKQIAQILQIPVGTVKSRLFHARAALRHYLEQEGIQL